MKTCPVCEKPLDSGVIVHRECLAAILEVKEHTLTEVEDKIKKLSPDLPFGVNHNYDEGYRAGIAAALKIVKDMHDVPAKQEAANGISSLPKMP